MKILHLTLKKKWFDMILSGEKKEEYREIKPYWINRLCWHEFHKQANDLETLNYCRHNAQNGRFPMDVFNNNYDAICFKNGYAKDAPSMTIEFKGIDVGFTKPEWSDNWQGEVFKIKLGEIIQSD